MTRREKALPQQFLLKNKDIMRILEVMQLRSCPIVKAKRLQKLIISLLFFILIFLSQTVKSQQLVKVGGSENSDFARLIFDSGTALDIEIYRESQNYVLLVFDSEIHLPVQDIVKLFPNYFAKAKIHRNLRQILLELKDNYQIEHTQVATAHVIDFQIEATDTINLVETEGQRAVDQVPPEVPKNDDLFQTQLNEKLTIDPNSIPTEVLVTLRTSLHQTFGRLVFDFGINRPTHRIALREGNVRIKVSNFINSKPQEVTAALSKYLYSTKLGNNNSMLELDLRQGVEIRDFVYRNSLVVDFIQTLPNQQTQSKIQPRAITDKVESKQAPSELLTNLPTTNIELLNDTPSSVERIDVRYGIHPDYLRLVFDFTKQNNYLIDHKNDRLDLTFFDKYRFNLPELPKSIPPGIENPEQQLLSDSSQFSLKVDQLIPVKHFRYGNKLVVDLHFSERNPLSDVAKTIANYSGSSQVTNKKESEKLSKELTDDINANRGRSNDKDQKAEAVLYFEWIDPVSLAVFNRSRDIFIVFDQRALVDIESLKEQTNGKFSDIKSIVSTNATVLQLKPIKNLYPHVEQIGYTWVIRFYKNKPKKPKNIELEIIEDKTGLTLSFPVGNPGKVIEVQDIEVGDELLVGTMSKENYGVGSELAYPGMQILETAQGIAVLHLDDDIDLKTYNRGFQISRLSGLPISKPDNVLQTSSSQQQTLLTTRLLPLNSWLKKDQRIERAFANIIANDKDNNRIKKLTNLAGYYLVNSLYVEAKGVAQLLDSVLKKPANQHKMLMAAIGIMSDSSKLVDKYLFDKNITKYAENKFWQGVYYGKQKNWQTAFDKFQSTNRVTDIIPNPLFHEVMNVKLETFLNFDSFEIIDDTILQMTNRDQSLVKVPQKRWLEYLTSLRDNMIGQNIRSEYNLAKLAKDSDKAGSYANYKLININLNNSKITEKEAIEELEKAKLSWRGDQLELDILEQSAALQKNNKEYMAALENYRQALSFFPNEAKTEIIKHDMIRLFRDLFDLPKGEITSEELYNIYQNFKELTPPGEDATKTTDLLIDRLFDSDYITVASNLLSRQVEFILKDSSLTRGKIRLAILYLLINKVEEASKIVNIEFMDSLELDDPYRHDVTLIIAYTDALNQNYSSSLNLLAGDISKDADLIRRDIALVNGDWLSMSRALERLSGAPPSKKNTIINKSNLRQIISWAVTLYRLNDKEGLRLLSNQYGDHLPLGEISDLFIALTSNNNISADQLLLMVSNLDNLAPPTGFIEQIQKRYFNTII